MVEKVYEIRVYRTYRGLRGTYDERLLENRRMYTAPSEEDIYDAILDNKGEQAEVKEFYLVKK